MNVVLTVELFHRVEEQPECIALWYIMMPVLFYLWGGLVASVDWKVQGASSSCLTACGALNKGPLPLKVQCP